MDELSEYTGIGQFGRAYKVMLENDCHAPGSVDSVLVQRMVRLCPETADDLYSGYTPTRTGYGKGRCPELEHLVDKAVAGCQSDEDRIGAICTFCSSLGDTSPEDLDDVRVGGTEEEIIRRGSDWCTDVARAACALFQVSGFPARLVYLAETSRAYSGHAIAEVHRNGAWGAVDAVTAVVYRHPDGRQASPWELMGSPPMIEVHRRATEGWYTKVEQFRRAAISNYFIQDREDYDFTITGINDYYRAILEMASLGWPGGLRWLQGEDSSSEPI